MVLNKNKARDAHCSVCDVKCYLVRAQFHFFAPLDHLQLKQRYSLPCNGHPTVWQSKAYARFNPRDPAILWQIVPQSLVQQRLRIRWHIPSPPVLPARPAQALIR